MNKRILMIGLDGATFDIIMPLIESNDLPMFKMLLERGIHSKLRVYLPITTYPNWKCYSTGKNPGKLGCFWFSDWDFKNKKFLKLHYNHGKK